MSSALISDTVKISDDLTIYYETAGSGPKTVLFIPGWGMSTQVFEKQLTHFAQSNTYRAITYDPRGQGRTTKTRDGHYYDQRGADLKAFIDALGLRNITLVGWSYGVLDQFSYISQFGIDQLDAAVIVDGTAKTVGDDNSIEWVWLRKDDADGSRQWYTMTPLVDRGQFNRAFAEWMLEDATEDNVFWLSEISNQTDNTTMAILNETASYADYSQALEALNGKLPLLVIVREEWSDVVRNHVKEKLSCAKVSVFGKHMMFWEHSERFNSELSAFLDSLD
ncbi:MAG: alpha/beta hydrolase [Pseudomonadota bacterium]